MKRGLILFFLSFSLLLYPLLNINIYLNPINFLITLFIFQTFLFILTISYIKINEKINQSKNIFSLLNRLSRKIYITFLIIFYIISLILVSYNLKEISFLYGIGYFYFFLPFSYIIFLLIYLKDNKKENFLFKISVTSLILIIIFFALNFLFYEIPNRINYSSYNFSSLFSFSLYSLFFIASFSYKIENKKDVTIFYILSIFIPFIIFLAKLYQNLLFFYLFSLMLYPFIFTSLYFWFLIQNSIVYTLSKENILPKKYSRININNNYSAAAILNTFILFIIFYLNIPLSYILYSLFYISPIFFFFIIISIIKSRKYIFASSLSLLAIILIFLSIGNIFYYISYILIFLLLIYLLVYIKDKGIRKIKREILIPIIYLDSILKNRKIWKTLEKILPKDAKILYIGDNVKKIKKINRDIRVYYKGILGIFDIVLFDLNYKKYDKNLVEEVKKILDNSLLIAIYKEKINDNRLKDYLSNFDQKEYEIRDIAYGKYVKIHFIFIRNRKSLH